MSWWRRVAFPVRRFWLTLATRVRARKSGGGILKLRNDVQTCGYQDVQVMWEILRRAEMEIPKENKRSSFWRMPIWSNNKTSCVSDKDHHHHHHHHQQQQQQQQKQKQQQKHHSSF